jgi:hypothetical protein
VAQVVAVEMLLVVDLGTHHQFLLLLYRVITAVQVQEIMVGVGVGLPPLVLTLQ